MVLFVTIAQTPPFKSITAKPIIVHGSGLGPFIHHKAHWRQTWSLKLGFWRRWRRGLGRSFGRRCRRRTTWPGGSGSTNSTSKVAIFFFESCNFFWPILVRIASNLFQFILIHFFVGLGLIVQGRMRRRRRRPRSSKRTRLR